MRNMVAAAGLMIAAAPSLAQDAVTELAVRPGEPIDATVEGRPARLLVGSGRIDRLTLDTDYVAANGIKPATLMGRAEVTVAGRREFKGRNRPLTFSVAGRVREARAFWFDGAPDRGADGSIGPLGLPQERVVFLLGPTDPTDVASKAPLSGNVDGSGFVGFRVGDGGMAVTFDVEDGERYPVASAAAGALIARTFGGQVSGPSWDVEILMGVKRPVRLLTLERPLVVGPLSFSAIAVRVRDRIDASGRGSSIADADADAVADPSEVVVATTARNAPKPIYTLSIPRASLARCSRLTYDKPAAKIELLCRPGG